MTTVTATSVRRVGTGATVRSAAAQASSAASFIIRQPLFTIASGRLEFQALQRSYNASYHSQEKRFKRIASTSEPKNSDNIDPVLDKSESSAFRMPLSVRIEETSQEKPIPSRWSLTSPFLPLLNNFNDVADRLSKRNLESIVKSIEHLRRHNEPISHRHASSNTLP